MVSGLYLAQTEHNLNSRTALPLHWRIVCVKNFIMEQAIWSKGAQYLLAR